MPSKKCKANDERLKGCKRKLYPTENQKSLLDRNIEVARAVYNLALEIQIKNRDAGNKYIQYFDICKIFQKLRNEDQNFKWLNDVSIGVIREALLDADNAFMKFFAGLNRFPRFKSKKSKKSFTTRSDRTRIKGNYVQISGLSGELIDAKKHHIPDDVALHNTTVTFDGTDYWFSCTYEKDSIDYTDKPKTDVIGVDVGIRKMMATSDGQFYYLPDTSKEEEKLSRISVHVQKYIKRYTREAERTRTKYEDVPKSKNYSKLLAKQRKCYKKISNKRKTAIHTATKRIVENNPKAIVIETIKVNQIIRDKPFMKKYKPQMMFYEIHRQLDYKAADRGIPVFRAPTDFPSTQICSACGAIRKVSPSVKTFKCQCCGLKIDRDTNAAINLKNLVHEEDNKIVFSIDA